MAPTRKERKRLPATGLSGWQNGSLQTIRITSFDNESQLNIKAAQLLANYFFTVFSSAHLTLRLLSSHSTMLASRGIPMLVTSAIMSLDGDEGVDCVTYAASG
jgi:hypothetical protein